METTVITPTLPSRSRLLIECIESVVSQTLPAQRHLIGVDLRRDGPSRTRDALVRAASTPWISFLDDDDLMEPDHLESHATMVEEADVIFSWATMLHPDGTIETFDVGFDADVILNHHNMIPITVTMKRELYHEVGGFDWRTRFEDWDLWKRCIRAGARFKGVPRITWMYRRQPDGRNNKLAVT